MPPDFINKPHERRLWERPWTVPAASDKAKDFKAKLWEHGYLSPNFKRSEFASRADSCSCATAAIPETLRARAQYHAFRLEVARHELGDKPMAPLSAYRSPCHNGCVGGATQSQHMNAWATDWSDDMRARLGGERFDEVMETVFAHGGRGYVRVVGGQVRHVDNGPERTWVYA